MTKLTIPAQVSSVKDFLSPQINTSIEQLETYFYSEKINIALILAENRFYEEWKEAIKSQPNFNFQIYIINQSSGLNAIAEVRFSDIIITASSVMQMVTKDLYQGIEPIKTWKKPLFIFLHGFNLIGSDTQTIERKLSEAQGIFPYSPSGIYGIGNGHPLLSDISSYLKSISEIYIDKKEDLRNTQRNPLENELREMVNECLTPQQEKVKKQTQKFQQEIQTNIHSADLQKNQGSSLTNFVRSYFDSITSALKNLEPEPVLVNLNKKVQHAPFSEDYYFQHLEESVFIYLMERQKEITLNEEELLFRFHQFLNNTAAYWAQGLSIWERIDGPQSQLFQSWAVSDQIAPHFQSFYERYKTDVLAIPPFMETKTKDLTLKYFQKYKSNLKEGLKRTYNSEKEDNGEKSLVDTGKTKYWMDDSLQMLNLKTGSDLVPLLNTVLGAIRSDFVEALENHRRSVVQTCDDLQMKAIAGFTDKLIAALQLDYAEFEARYQALLDFKITA